MLTRHAFVAGAASANVIAGYLTYPGVLFHELSRAAAALLSGARVTGISPGRVAAADGSGWVLGSVTFMPRGFAPTGSNRNNGGMLRNGQDEPCYICAS